eukprot:754984-Hanusia_phi.AAC.4
MAAVGNEQEIVEQGQQDSAHVYASLRADDLGICRVCLGGERAVGQQRRIRLSDPSRSSSSDTQGHMLSG